jgi:hypothetical protein
MSLRRVLFGITLLSISVLTTAIDTQARDQLRFQRGQRTRSNSFMNKTLLRPTTTLKGSRRVHAVSLSKREFEKLVKSAIRKCRCASVVQDTEFSASCVRGCVAGYVGWPTVLGCLTACGGNLVGCAICVGVHEWVVLGCIQYCAWRGVISYVDGPVVSNRGRPSSKGQGRSLMRSPVSASSS